MTMFAFEGVGVATAMPTVALALGGQASYAWAFNAYLLASLVGMVLAGEWCDARGPRQSIIAAVVLFGTGALVSGAAWSMPVLIGGRFIEGLGGGLGIVSIYVVLGRGFDDDIRPRAFALLAAAWVVPSIVGPFVAGYLADSVSWRWVFWVATIFVVPPAVLLAPRLGRLNSVGPVAAGARASGSRRLRLALVAAAGLALLQEGGTVQGWIGLVLAAVGLALLGPALVRLLPPGTLRFARGLPTVVMLRGLLAGAFIGGEAFIPLALQEVRGLTPTQAGLILTSGAIGWATGAQIQSRRYQAWGPIRLLQAGSGCVVGGLVTMPFCLTTLPPWVAVFSWTLTAIGMGMSFGTLGNQTLTLSTSEDQGSNSAALQICDSVGSVVLLAMAGTIYTAAHTRGSVSAGTFDLIWLTMAGAGVIAAITCSRMRVQPTAPTPITAAT
jgi:MFS family permease